MTTTSSDGPRGATLARAVLVATRTRVPRSSEDPIGRLMDTITEYRQQFPAGSIDDDEEIGHDH